MKTIRLVDLSVWQNYVTWRFNLAIDNKRLENFMSTFDLECLIKEPTCLPSSNQTCIYLSP